MWKCPKCEYKNNNSSLTCHGNKCDGKRGKIPDKTKKVLDLCPKCNKETIFTFERNKMVEIEQETIGGGHRTKTIVEKRYRCTECQSLCRQRGKSKSVIEMTVPDADTGDGAL